jgi:hypothetical protein
MTAMRMRPLLLLLCAAGTAAGAQSPTGTKGSPNEVTLFAESFAGGVQYLRVVGGPWRLGVQLAAGPSEGVLLSEEGFEELRSWATGYLAIGYRAANGFEAVVSPIGVAVLSGSDFAAAYPSGQLLLGLGTGRLRIGSVLRVVRIAGGNGSGDYRTEWIPIRVGITLGS